MNSPGNGILTNKLKNAVRANGTIKSGTGSNKKINNLTAQNLASFSGEPISMNKMGQYKNALKKVAANKKSIQNIPINRSKVGTSKTNNNIKSTNNMKNTNLSIPTKWIESYKSFMKSYNLSQSSMNVNITKNNQNNSLENKLKKIISNRKKYTDKINFITNILNQANNLLKVQIMNQANFEKSNTVKTKSLNQNNINAIYEQVELRKIKLNNILQSIGEKLTNLKNKQQEYEKSSNDLINNYITRVYSSAITEINKNIEGTTQVLLNISTKLNKALANTNIKQIKTEFENLKNKQTIIKKSLNNSKTLLNSFQNIKQSLNTLKYNTTKLNKNFNEEGQKITNQIQTINNKIKKYSNNIQNKIKNLNSKINTSAKDLEVLTNKIIKQSAQLKKNVQNNLSKNVQNQLTNLIDKLTETINMMNEDLNGQISKFSNMKKSLVQLIGTKNLNLNGSNSTIQRSTNASTDVQKALAKRNNGVVLTSSSNKNGSPNKQILNNLQGKLKNYKVPTNAKSQNNRVGLQTTRDRLLNGIEKLSTINPTNNNNKKKFGIIKGVYNGKLKQIENLLKNVKPTNKP